MRASELATYGFCPEAHRLDAEEAQVGGLAVPSAPGADLPTPQVRAWDSPEARHGRASHLRVTRVVERPTGAWTTRSALIVCGLAILASLILRFG